jgi:hypothetical protein
MNGSGARASRSAKASQSRTEPISRPRIAGEVQAKCVPPQLIASIMVSAAQTISAPPGTSSLCGRSFLGRRRR